MGVTLTVSVRVTLLYPRQELSKERGKKWFPFGMGNFFLPFTFLPLF